jgi:hypothetical protein
MPDPSDQFICDTYKCKLSMGTCVSRQTAAGKNGKAIYPTCAAGKCLQGLANLMVMQQIGYTPAPYKQMQSNIRTTLVKIRKHRAAEAAAARELAERAARR